jgi:hypothetical protein
MLNSDKLALIDVAIRRYQISSFADLGGVWLVDGGYSTYALDRGVAQGILVDLHTEALSETVGSRPNLKLIKGNFADSQIAQRIEADAVFLFDVLLHQVMPDWEYVLSLYAKQTRLLLIFNQQWTATRRSIRLVELGEQEFFRNTPNTRDDPLCRDLFAKLYEACESEYHNWGARAYKDISTIWQWGITDSDLIAAMSFHGFELVYYQNHGQAWELPNFEHHAFLFAK